MPILEKGQGAAETELNGVWRPRQAGESLRSPHVNRALVLQADTHLPTKPRPVNCSLNWKCISFSSFDNVFGNLFTHYRAWKMNCNGSVSKDSKIMRTVSPVIFVYTQNYQKCASSQLQKEFYGVCILLFFFSWDARTWFKQRWSEISFAIYLCGLKKNMPAKEFQMHGSHKGSADYDINQNVHLWNK